MRIILPARLESTRLPRKMLLDVCGEPLIRRAALQVRALAIPDAEVLVATDSGEIADAVGAAVPVLMTSSRPQNGTERVAEAIRQLDLPDDEVVVNVQPDQLYVPPEAIHWAAAWVERAGYEVGTVAASLKENDEALGASRVVKVLVDPAGRARGFARQIAWHGTVHAIGRHVGIYAYTAETLARWLETPAVPLEAALGLEVLRAWVLGGRIGVAWLPEAREAPPTVDAEEDVEPLRQIVRTHQACCG